MLPWASKQVRSIFIFIIFITATAAVGESLRVSTFNIRWYGLDNLSDASNGRAWRDKWLRQTMDKELMRSDVIVFEEIVDVGRFKRNLIRGKMDCLTYYHDNAKHQHVVICHQKKYRFDKADGDNNYTMESVTWGTNKGRPALYGILRRKQGRAVAYIVGVHLKAFPDETAKRLKQTHAIARRLRQLQYDIPIIITGDFNTHYSDKTQWYKHDYKLIDDIFRQYRLSLYEVYNPSNTYVSLRGQNKFDRFWVSNSVQVESRVAVSRLCVSPKNLSENQITWYNENVSDHCLVTVNLELD